MRKAKVSVAALVALALSGSVGALPAQRVETGPKVGEVAPEFALGGATRYGILRDQVKLSDYKGRTVVLAFFFKARTRG